MKQKRYLNVTIALCRNCGGRGMVAVAPADGEPSVDSVVESVCPICQGSGRVKVRRDVTINVEPYGDSDRF